MELHGGAIECSSEEGHGAEFRVYLPLPVDNVVREPSQKRPIQTILLAEDDPGVREFVAQLLAEDGYKVLVAQDGVEAVTLFNSKSQDVDLALLDVLMPRMTGPEAFKIMREKNPNLRVIFSSGHIMDSKELLSGELEKCPLLRKPFFQEELRKAIFAAST
ncbi:MAG: hybrid sensor histidine kinase/response regulator [Deltaproteobacteria bacterium]|nr:hybrid sensor histidine kinase/response regulator [Deltaproteobacteria bacterium]